MDRKPGNHDYDPSKGNPFVTQPGDDMDQAVKIANSGATPDVSSYAIPQTSNSTQEDPGDSRERRGVSRRNFLKGLAAATVTAAVVWLAAENKDEIVEALSGNNEAGKVEANFGPDIYATAEQGDGVWLLVEKHVKVSETVNMNDVVYYVVNHPANTSVFHRNGTFSPENLQPGDTIILPEYAN